MEIKPVDFNDKISLDDALLLSRVAYHHVEGEIDYFLIRVVDACETILDFLLHIRESDFDNSRQLFNHCQYAKPETRKKVADLFMNDLGEDGFTLPLFEQQVNVVRPDYEPDSGNVLLGNIMNVGVFQEFFAYFGVTSTVKTSLEWVAGVQEHFVVRVSLELRVGELK